MSVRPPLCLLCRFIRSPAPTVDEACKPLQRDWSSPEPMQTSVVLLVITNSRPFASIHTKRSLSALESSNIIIDTVMMGRSDTFPHGRSRRPERSNFRHSTPNGESHVVWPGHSTADPQSAQTKNEQRVRFAEGTKPSDGGLSDKNLSSAVGSGRAPYRPPPKRPRQP